MLVYEYYNAELFQNTALKIADTVGVLTPPDGKAFGVKSALTNLETVSSSMIEDYSAVRVHTLGVSIPTEEAVQAYVNEIFGGSADGITINKSVDGELQAIGLINKNNADVAVNPVYDWVGTKTEYAEQNVAELHPDWLCFITDDAYDPGATYVYEQEMASDTWTITHNLNKQPSVTVVDSAGSMQIPDEISYDNANQITITFLGSFAGKAFLN